MGPFRKIIVGSVVMASLVFNAAPVEAKVRNGSFESGFNGWTVANGGSGSWFTYAGPVTPLTGQPIPAPPHKTFAAVTDQTGRGRHALITKIKVPERHPVLRFVIFYENASGVFASPPNLDHTGAPNQQYRIDILKHSATPFSLDPADVLMNVFRTQPGDPASLAPTKIRKNLRRFAGRTVLLRFAEVDNLFFFFAGVDRVSVKGKPSKPDLCKRGAVRGVCNNG